DPGIDLLPLVEYLVQPAGRGLIEGSCADDAKHALEHGWLRAAHLRRDSTRELGRLRDELIGESAEDAPCALGKLLAVAWSGDRLKTLNVGFEQNEIVPQSVAEVGKFGKPAQYARGIVPQPPNVDQFLKRVAEVVGVGTCPRGSDGGLGGRLRAC